MKVCEIKDKILSDKPEEVKGQCFFCGKEVDGMFWCFGCHHFICGQCDTYTDEPMGKHNVQKHQTA